MTLHAEESSTISHQTRCAADSIPSFSSAVASGETSSNAGDRTLTGTAPGQNLGGFEMKTNNNDMFLNVVVTSTIAFMVINMVIFFLS